MSTPTHSLKFRWPWRPYQERVLASVNQHISQDQKLHVVAAPGSGKTTLGLEVFRRIAKPALVLSPTRTIRDQWVNRLQDFLSDPNQSPAQLAWVSKNLDTPAFFTSITYQALHTRYRKTQNGAESPEQEAENLDKAPTRTEIKAVVEKLQAANVGTLILDEAHHLRAEWWRALAWLLDAMPQLVLISLTATPPYDVQGLEWQRYQELCGVIDEEVSVPELVKVGTLCPHQDFVYAVTPLPEETSAARSYDQAVEQLCRDLLKDPLFNYAVENHAWIKADHPPVEAVLKNPALALALLSFLAAQNKPLPANLLSLLDATPADIPSLDRRWWQTLIQGYLWDTTWLPIDETDEEMAADEEEALSPEADNPNGETVETPAIPIGGDLAADLKQHRRTLARRLRQDSLLNRRELNLSSSRPIKTQLALSAAKIPACLEIYRLEAQKRGEYLRQVILTDFIRDESLGAGAVHQRMQLGAWPVFRYLVQSNPSEQARYMGLLTGRLAIVHQDHLAALQASLPDETLNTSPAPELPDFLRVSGSERLTDAFTSLLKAGNLRVLVGTRALLGEGWDAPVINSLILASFIGSFMLTNQMRGRAIRVDPQQPNKAASIWHLVAIETDTPSGLGDMDDLQRRFETFVGLSTQAAVIESGLGRLNLPEEWTADAIPQNNAEMSTRIQAIDQLKAQWESAINQGMAGRVLPAITVAKTASNRAYHVSKTAALSFWIVGLVLALVVALMIYRATDAKNLHTLLSVLILGLVGVLIFTLPHFIRTLWQSWRQLSPTGSLKQMGNALRDALVDAGMFSLPRRHYSVKTVELEKTVSITLHGGSFYEQSLFTDCLKELLAPIENPRYLISRQSGTYPLHRKSYHAVPLILAVKKERAELFATAWKKRVGAGDLIYTRTPEGRALLLKFRARSFSSDPAEEARRQERWQ